MGVLFAGGEFEAFDVLGDVAGTTGEFEFDTGVTAAFDSDFARGSMKMRRSSVVRADIPANIEGWLHFRLYHTGFNNANLDSPLVRLVDTSTLAGGRAACVFGEGSGSMDFGYWTGAVYTNIAVITTGPGNTLELNTLYTFDIHWKIHATEGIFEIFVDGVSQGSFEGDTTDGDVATIDGFDLSAGMKSTATIFGYYSEVIVSTESTIGMRLATLGATANSSTNNAFTNGEPEIDDIGEPTDLTLIRSGTANQIQEFVVEDISAGASAEGLDIAAVVVSARAMAGSSVVQNIKASLRTNSLPFVSANLTVNSEHLKPVIGVFDVNPDTTSDWTEAQVNAAEFGLKSIA